MTNEEFEKRIGFILEQQAQFTSDIQQLREVQTQTEQIVGNLPTVTLEGFKDINVKIKALVDSHIGLTGAQTRTDENLRNLIAVADRYVNEGRNGKQPE